MPSTFFISADLGQVNDFTAITVLERVIKTEFYSYLGRTIEEEVSREFHLRHIERPERGTTYPKIVDRLKELADSPQLTEKEKVIVIDITGVGRPVWDLIRKNDFADPIKGITITGGNTVTNDGSLYYVPKRDLVSSLQVAFQNGQLKITQDLPEADTFVRELMNFKVKINLSGHDQYGASSDWREGVHDDIVLSVAMGVWLANNFQWCVWSI
jgi:hypothetical protein